ncbi:PAQR family membrane homeostasis protein TrhA [Isoptericola sp. NPDC055881]
MAAAARPKGRDDVDAPVVQDVVEGAKHAVSDAREAVSDAVEDAVETVSEAAAHLKPFMRGWIHAVTTPLALAASIVLVALADTTADKVACAIFGVTAVLLFGTSAVYHRGTWSPRTAAVLRRLDHANIFLIIAGTYTPLAVMLLPRSTATVLLAVVWSGAILGLVARVLWMGAPRWVYVPVYVALGCVAVGYIPQFSAAGGAAVGWLVASGGVAYILGAVVYGTKRPNPSPRWFGFHEIFHALTVVGFTCHTVAIYLAAL